MAGDGIGPRRREFEPGDATHGPDAAQRVRHEHLVPVGPLSDRRGAELNRDPEFYGLPEGGRGASLVLASFNIRKLGSSKNREREIDFLARFCVKCDLIAIQEVQDSLEGLRRLKDQMEIQMKFL